MNARVKAKLIKILIVLSSFVTGMIATKNAEVAKVVSDVVNVITE